LPSNQLRIFENEIFGNRVAIINSFSEDEIIVGYHNNWIAVLNKNLELVFKEKLSFREEEVYDADFNKINNALYVAVNFGIFTIKNNPYRIKKILPSSGLKTVEVGDDEFWYGDFRSARHHSSDNKNSTFLPKRTYSIEQGLNGDLWVGTVDGYTI